MPVVQMLKAKPVEVQMKLDTKPRDVQLRLDVQPKFQNMLLHVDAVLTSVDSDELKKLPWFL